MQLDEVMKWFSERGDYVKRTGKCGPHYYLNGQT